MTWLFKIRIQLLFCTEITYISRIQFCYGPTTSNTCSYLLFRLHYPGHTFSMANLNKNGKINYKVKK